MNYIEVEYRDEDNHHIKTEQIVKNTCISDTSRTSPFYGLFKTCVTMSEPAQVQTN